jgi:hypothetical protein
MKNKSVSKITAKTRHRLKLIEHMSDPANDWPQHTDFPKILDISESALYQHFTAAELAEIDHEAITLRRSRYSAYSGHIDSALVKQCKKGDTQAIKLFFQRFENWSEKVGLDHSVQSVDDIIHELESE